MCGFVALFGKKDKYSSSKIVQKMINRISHRGPDNINIVNYDNFTGGFSRLSIIDLDNRANQPFIISHDDNLVLFYNGETYNYQELKRELENFGHDFITTSDTEVVYRSILQWGNKFVDKLIGMFSIMIYRPISNQIELYRDHLGIKPLYYYMRDDLVFIASEVKAISNVVDLKIDKNQIIEYLRFGTNLDENLIFKDVKSVLPGQCIKFDKNLSINKTKYFNLIDTFNAEKTTPDYDLLKHEIINSILIHTRSDVKYGTQLSGGLDSSFITSIIANKSNKPLKTFSITLDHKVVDESKYQRRLINDHRLDNSSVNFNLNMFNDINYLKRSIYFYDFPLHHPNIVASDIMNEQASKEGYKVLLSGEGADEMFAGYKWHLNDFSLMHNQQIIANSSYNRISDLEKVFSIKNNNTYESLFLEMNSLSNFEDRQLYFEQRYYLQKWFHRQDRSGMRFSLEIRVPYCTHILARLLNSYKLSSKTNNNRCSKHLLKVIAEGFLPNDIVWRKKVGFTIPIDDWFRNKLSRNLIEILIDDRTLSRDLYNNDSIIKIVKDHLCGISNNGRLIWALLNFELWYRIFFEEKIIYTN